MKKWMYKQLDKLEQVEQIDKFDLIEFFNRGVTIERSSFFT